MAARVVPEMTSIVGRVPQEVLGWGFWNSDWRSLLSARCLAEYRPPTLLVMFETGRILALQTQ